MLFTPQHVQPMAAKRRRSSSSTVSGIDSHPSKKTRIIHPHDRISSLSDELIIRILHHLPIRTLISCHLISHKFCSLAGDSQIWKNLYYNRFVLPRALRIPGLRASSLLKQDDALHFASRRSKWLDDDMLVNRIDGKTTNWKKQYKLRHNWSIGACGVTEIHVSDRTSVPEMLVRLVEGVVVTADKKEGLRAWDLKKRAVIAKFELGDDIVPTCLAVDEQDSKSRKLGIAVGFMDGGWAVWNLDIEMGIFQREFRHPESSNGILSAIAFSNPYVLTITEEQLLSLYSFTTAPIPDPEPEDPTNILLPTQEPPTGTSPSPSPRLLASLKSHTSWPPLSLSIRTTPSHITCSIAYCLPTYLSGHTVGLQELHLSSITGLITSSRLASALPSFTSISPSSPSSSQPGVYNSRPTTLSYSHPYILATHPDNTLTLYLCHSTTSSLSITPGTKLWGHTSSVSSAEITPRGKAVSVSTRGNELRVWELEGGASFAWTAGSPTPASLPTSISRAQKRSLRMAERSVQILPAHAHPKILAAAVSSKQGGKVMDDDDDHDGEEVEVEDMGASGRNERGGEETQKRWVGFDDEMVIVLKEDGGGTQALVVYDFT